MNSPIIKDSVKELIKTLIIVTSILGIFAYFLGNSTFFMFAGCSCAAIVLMLGGCVLMTALPFIWIHFSVYLIQLILLEVIGCLVTKELGSGLLLGTCFAGLGIVALTKYLSWVHGWLTENAPGRLSPDYNPYEKEEGEESPVMEAILLDENASPENRVTAMSTAFERMDYAFSTMDRCKAIILSNRETMQALKRYMDSGLWQKDFEAAERGEIDTEGTLFSVLSEDGLYNFLNDAEEILKEVSSLNQNN